MLRLLCCLLPLLCALAAGAQVPNQSSSAGVSSSTSGSTSGHVSADPNVNRPFGSELPIVDANFSHRQMIARREERKKRMVDNADRLLMMTRDLQTELQSREANPADAKRLDDIAKLARSVRDQMRQ
ncbi:MAG: hypothetical protein ACRYF4_00770 [Janthinobacterium lividum]